MSAVIVDSAVYRAGKRIVDNLPPSELDRVRTFLSCAILVGLLALIIIGGRKTALMPPPAHTPTPDVLSETFLLMPLPRR